MSRKAIKWEVFEEESCNYLNELYSHLPVSFHPEGGKNSAASDIRVEKEGKLLFSIEAKYSPSQSGQFVIVDQDDKYALSNESKFENNAYTQAIIDYLNEHKTRFTPEGQGAVPVDVDQEILAQWITEHYKRKDSHFVITSTVLDDYKSIIPIEEVKDYFDISAVVRRKKSGTRDVARYKIEDCMKELEKYIETLGLEIGETIKQSSKTLVIFNKDIDLKKSERYFGEDFFLSPNSKGEGYYLKTRSKTNNLNVIFSLVYTGPEEHIGVDVLEKFIGDSLSS